MGLTSSSGGFFYHYLAFRYASLWKPFQKLATQLGSKFIPSQVCNTLYLAPSGTYTFDSLKFQHSHGDNPCRFTFVDIDPLSKFVLSFKLPFKFQFVQSSVESFLETNKQNFDFICVGNFLGQKIQNKKAVAGLLENYLKDKNFFIQYDRFSFKVSADKNKQVKQMEWSKPGEWMQNWQALRANSLTDHETHNLFEGLSKSHLIWEIRPNTFHLVELVGNKVK